MDPVVWRLLADAGQGSWFDAPRQSHPHIHTLPAVQDTRDDGVRPKSSNVCAPRPGESGCRVGLPTQRAQQHGVQSSPAKRPRVHAEGEAS